MIDHAIPFTSPHFHLARLADGVYGAIAADDGGAVGNAGIVDLGDRALIFDTTLTPQAADDMRAAAERLVGHPIAHVVNSHWHGTTCGAMGPSRRTPRSWPPRGRAT